ncbi:MAG: hypothetical protein GY805_33595 [Chloroflexi bacterium]|nr:hypothetical protein [Chloroflexota bacterium]
MTENITADYNLMVISDKPDSPWSTTVNEALMSLGKLYFFAERDALTQIGKQSYDLIIIASGDIDSDMGVLVKQLHASRPETPIVVTTNSPTWRRAREAFLAGATDYVRRTLDKEKILLFYKKILQ